MSDQSQGSPAIIFDFGGVLLNLSYQATVDAFGEHCGDLLHYDPLHQQVYFDQFERGEISANDFRKKLRLAANRPHLSDDVIDQAWNAMLGDFPQERLTFLRSLAVDFRLFLLSNTNEIHKSAFDLTLRKSFGGDSQGFDKLFEAAYYSHEIGHRKPEAAAYAHILNTHKLNPTMTWFIDDNPQNIAGADALGIKTIHLTEDLMVWYEHTGRRLFYPKLY